MLFYLENDLTGVRGEENLYLHQLRDGARSTRLAAKCCESILAVDHPAYAGKVIMVPSDACTLTTSGALPAAHARIYMKDHNEARDGPLPPGEAPEKVFSGAESDWVERLGHRAFFERPRPVPFLGFTLPQLCARLSAQPVVLGLAEGEQVGNRRQ